MSAFNDWYNRKVGFQTNSKHIMDDLFWCSPEVESEVLERWLKECWNKAITAAYIVCKDEGTRYPWEEARAAIDALKEKT